MGMGTDVAGTGTVFTGTDGDGVQFLSTCRPVVLTVIIVSNCQTVSHD